MSLVVSSGCAERALCEGTTGNVIAVLPKVWAAGELRVEESQTAAAKPLERPKAEIAFYRKYTEAMVRRYRTLSMAAGRVPSLVGRELFRGRVTSYRVQSFEDAVIFCHDMEKCLLKLNKAEQRLVKRIALQQYTFGEAAGVLGLSLGNCIRQYGRAVDRLTGILLEVKLLQPLNLCQEGKRAPEPAKASRD